MKIVKQEKNKVIVELDPMEAEMLQKSMVRHTKMLDKKWEALETKIPEEFLYHAARKDNADGLKRKFGMVVNRFREWGVLK
ncbi:hypothetical protein [Bacillus phage CP-51]|uniref:Uncharacterized protein n=1 Tax=Bacillus phage CP-51 TaxID=1391188 RepID=A0A068EU34_9CAUD|nr:hypothetical protein OZ73_gp056 [Bacillus phage CP-51]AID50491.1 hypothetical protein [Bacillus phage CP-51]